MFNSGRGDTMKIYIVVGLVVLISISLVSAYYTHDLEVQETEKGQSISKEIETLESQAAEVESRISQTEQKTSEIDPLIQEEQDKQRDIQDQTEALTVKEEELKEKIQLQKEIAKRDPRVLITLDDPVVIAKVKEVTRLSRTTEEKQQAIFEYVRKEIEYMYEGNPKKWSYPHSFLQFKSDFWQLPRETIEWGTGDCEDRSILLCTMMRIAGVPADNVRVVFGTVQGSLGHAWIEFKKGDEWYALESTCPGCNYITRSVYYQYYYPDVWGWFNDKEYHDETSGETNSLISYKEAFFI